MSGPLIKELAIFIQWNPHDLASDDDGPPVKSLVRSEDREELAISLSEGASWTVKDRSTSLRGRLRSVTMVGPSHGSKSLV